MQSITWRGSRQTPFGRKRVGMCQIFHPYKVRAVVVMYNTSCELAVSVVRTSNYIDRCSYCISLLRTHTFACFSLSCHPLQTKFQSHPPASLLPSPPTVEPASTGSTRVTEVSRRRPSLSAPARQRRGLTLPLIHPARPCPPMPHRAPPTETLAPFSLPLTSRRPLCLTCTLWMGLEVARTH